MAKHGNKNSGNGGSKGGVCSHCEKPSDNLTSVRWHSPSGKGRMVKLCVDCTPITK
jgi:hypothetical protein